jgi:CHAT domain-containing protein
MLLGPVAEQLKGKRLVIISDGVLQYVPFGALPVPFERRKDEGGRMKAEAENSRASSSFILHPSSFQRPLIVEHEIVNLPSASTLAVLRREMAGRKSAAKTVAVLADPVFQREDERVRRIKARKKADELSLNSSGLRILEPEVERSAWESDVADAGRPIPRLPFTRREAEAILALVPDGEGMKALDFAASRAMATSAELGRYRMVHLATHGLLNSRHPELSGIVLSLVDERGRPQDGFLRLHEIYNLNLSADLVVLSACQTALGKEIKGEGLVGLTRGFMYAGASRVVASLWKVDDRATAELMKRFYQGMLGEDRLRPAAALRAAQVAMWKENRWKEPYYWAAFVLQGEWK